MYTVYRCLLNTFRFKNIYNNTLELHIRSDILVCQFLWFRSSSPLSLYSLCISGISMSASLICFSKGKYFLKQRQASCITWTTNGDNLLSLSSISSPDCSILVVQPWRRSSDAKRADAKCSAVDSQVGSSTNTEEASVSGRSLSTVTRSRIRRGMYLEKLPQRRPINCITCQLKSQDKSKFINSAYISMDEIMPHHHHLGGMSFE